MAKKNYTKAGAKRALDAMHSKGAKLMIDRYITPKEMNELHSLIVRLQRKIN